MTRTTTEEKWNPTGSYIGEGVRFVIAPQRLGPRLILSLPVQGRSSCVPAPVSWKYIAKLSAEAAESKDTVGNIIKNACLHMHLHCIHLHTATKYTFCFPNSCLTHTLWHACMRRPLEGGRKIPQQLGIIQLTVWTEESSRRDLFSLLTQSLWGLI